MRLADGKGLGGHGHLRPRLLVANVQCHPRALGAHRRGGNGQLVANGHAVSRAYLACVLGVVLKILLVENAVLVADEAEGGDVLRIKVDLELDVLGHGVEGAEQIRAKDLLGLAHAVDIVVNAVAVVGKRLHVGVTVVARAKAEHGEIDACVALFGHVALELVGRGDAHVEVTVRGHDDAVVAALDKVCLRDLVGAGQSCLAVGRAVGRKGVQGVENGLGIVSGAALKHHSLAARVGHDGDAVLGGQLRGEVGEGLLEQGELIRGVHRARNVDQEDEVVAHGGGGVVCLERHAHQHRGGIPGAGNDRGVHAEQLVLRRSGDAVAEIVDEFLGAEACTVGLQAGEAKTALADQLAEIGVGRRVHVGREGGNALLVGGNKGVFLHVRTCSVKAGLAWVGGIPQVLSLFGGRVAVHGAAGVVHEAVARLHGSGGTARQRQQKGKRNEDREQFFEVLRHDRLLSDVTPCVHQSMRLEMNETQSAFGTTSA